MNKNIRARRAMRLVIAEVVGLTLILFAASSASAQSTTNTSTPTNTPTLTNTPTNYTGNDLHNRISRARALAVAGNLIGAARELEAVRQAANGDESLLDVTRVLLMGVYIEQSDYTRAQTLLDETYNARGAGGESFMRAYYTLAGRLLNSVRAHLERYRAYGLNIAATENLPAEARADLNALRTLLERAVEQSRTLRGANESTNNTDAAALFEDAANLRASVARNEAEREQWQREVADARQRLATNNTRMADAVRRAEAQAERINAQTTTTTVAPIANQSIGSASESTPTPATAAPQNSVSESGSRDSTSSTPTAPPPRSTESGASTGSTSSQPISSNDSGGATNTPIQLGSLIERAIQRISPVYPSTARTARVAGVVTVYLVVNESGAVEMVQRTNGPALLQRAAEDAARRWRFRPTVVDGRAVRMAGFINFNFTL